MQAYVDASIVDDYSIHSFLLIHGKETVVKGCLKSNIQDSVQAEIVSAIVLLLECKKRKMKGVVVNTDSLSTTTLQNNHKKYGYLIIWMNRLLQLTDGSIQWIKRKLNKKADKMCKVARKSIETVKSVELKDMIERPDLVVSDTVVPKSFELKKSREYKGNHNRVDVRSLSEEDVKYLRHYYCTMVYKSKRKPIEDIINWNNKLSIDISKKGRRYFIENYLVKNHLPEDIVIEKASHAFDFY